MAIRIMIFRLSIWISLWASSPVFSQPADTLGLVYQKYHYTTLVAQDSYGKHLVLNHSNSYGKNAFEIWNTQKCIAMPVADFQGYQFLGKDYLMMRNNDRTRFQNLNTHQYRDMEGNFLNKVLNKTNNVLLYSTSSNDLACYSEKGAPIWILPHIQVYEVDEEQDRLIYFDGQQIGIMDLKGSSKKIYGVDKSVQWIRSVREMVYWAHIEPGAVEWCRLDVSSNKISQQRIACPDSFRFADALVNYFEIREDQHFLFPLFPKDTMTIKPDPELKITYSNKNSRDQPLYHREYHHLGIFDLKHEKWTYLPTGTEHLPVYKFLNDQGDFVVYDLARDIVEEQRIPLFDLNLVLDYGNRSYLLPQKRAEGGNYLWDSNTEKFIYFLNKRWRCYHVTTGKDHELLPLDTHGWQSSYKEGLQDDPEVSPILIKNRSAIMLSNQLDYFIIDLKTYDLKRITYGAEQHIKYELQLSKDNFSTSLWNIMLGQVDLQKDLMFKRFNEKTYQSGFERYIPGSNKTIVYNEGHYTAAIPYNNGILFTSQFALEPFAVSKMENGKSKVVYQASTEERKFFDSLHCHIFQYTTPYGTANAVLFFPLGYDQQKKYPLIVNIYEKRSREVLKYMPPSLRDREGFNYMHYLLNGYFVLLPDLQYELGTPQKPFLLSLEKSIDKARQIGSIAEKNIGILGLSYGGYETGLALTKSNYFKTGVAGVGAFDLVSMSLSNSDFIWFPNYQRIENQQFRMKEHVFDHWNNYLEHSPIYHLKNVKTPVLLWTGLKDKNAPPAQTKMFFLGMKRLQKQAVLLEYTNEGHGISSAKNQQDLNLRISEWFDYHLKSKAPAAWIRPLIE